MRKLSHQELVFRQEQKNGASVLPFVFVLNDIRSGYNVGSIFRTADGAGVAKIFLCGITGYPPNQLISKTALGAEQRVPWEHERDVRVVVRRLRQEGYEIVLLEQMESSVLYQDYHPKRPVCLVVGNEISGVSETILADCDQAIEIEMAGLKNSLNVAVAAGIAAYHIRNELQKRLSGITAKI
ncbi:MAG: TrmH family RNA methyltransferase [Candidatus Omnitrophica bacterium]|nr:TrmH family RNA methyltransferase [Candidatus Omnitrophota bacterium]